jgi:hypothetical protein
MPSGEFEPGRGVIGRAGPGLIDAPSTPDAPGQVVAVLRDLAADRLGVVRGERGGAVGPGADARGVARSGKLRVGFEAARGALVARARVRSALLGVIGVGRSRVLARRVRRIARVFVAVADLIVIAAAGPTLRTQWLRPRWTGSSWSCAVNWATDSSLTWLASSAMKRAVGLSS